jgi:peptide/nickel transport system substrate-binding protein
MCKPLGDVRVRQAINYAFDRTTIAKVLGAGYSTPTEQLFNPDSSAYDPALNQTYSYDPAKAKQLLAEAGYPNGFTCDGLDFSSFFAQAQAAVTQYLSAVGITLTPKTVPAAQILSSLQGAKVAISYFRLSAARPWDTVVSNLARDAVWNPFHYGDATMDGLIAKAKGSSGAAQDAAFKELNRYAVTQGWAAVWDAPQTVYVVKSSIAISGEAFSSVPPIYRFAPAG